jgi:Fe2+ transport system protein FeoA
VTAVLPVAAPVPAPTAMSLVAIVAGRRYRVTAVEGDDALAHRLAACGLWLGAIVERLGQAPFGNPLLVRVHGYRLALRTSEAARVSVVESPS